MDQTRYWLGFNLVRGIGPARLRRLLDYFGDVAAAWEAPAGELQATGLDRRSLENLLAVRRQVDLDQLVQRVAALGVQALTWATPAYPGNLLNIAAPPPVLFAKGSLAEADQWAVALVGTRRATAYGREMARELAAGLAASGVTVVSGLARGIDAAAHRAALDAGGRTIAVLGCGVDVVYPPEHRDLAAAIAGAGAVVSDYPLGTPPDAVNFPPRNRIISGLAKGVVVVEADEDSGALITTAFAAEQGRDVFAVPGNLNQRGSRGPNRLIQAGARLVTGVADILEELNLTRAADRQAVQMALPADDLERQLLEHLAAGPAHVDALCVELGRPVAQLSSALALLELKGLVRPAGGMHYALREPEPEYTHG